MLRSVGIPARFCTGYIPHYVDKSRNTFVVLAKDYHAWVEIYFPGYGWIEFEVTPGTITRDLIPENNDERLPGLSSANISDFPNYSPELMSDYPLIPDANQPGNTQNTGKATVIAIVLIVLLMLSAILTLSIIWRRKMKRKDAISEIMARMHLFSPLIGVPFLVGQTTQEYTGYLSEKLPSHQKEIQKLTQVFQSSRYSRGKLILQKDEGLLFKYWRSIFWGMMKRALFRFWLVN